VKVAFLLLDAFNVGITVFALCVIWLALR